MALSFQPACRNHARSHLSLLTKARPSEIAPKPAGLLARVQIARPN